MRKRICLTLLVSVLTLGVISPASALHSEAQLDIWFKRWTHQVLREGWNAGALIEFRDMMSRHPFYLSEPVEAAVSVSPPSQAATPTDSGMGSNWEAWRPLVAVYFPAGEVDMAICVIQYESGGNPDATNPTSGAAGLFQIMPGWQSTYPGDYYDPETNVAIARKIWNSGGWSHWTAQGMC